MKIKDSIRQGGVLSVVQYALLIDEINKEIQNFGLGHEIEGLAEIIAFCLLWMDDVALIATEPENLQKNARYHKRNSQQISCGIWRT